MIKTPMARLALGAVGLAMTGSASAGAVQRHPRLPEMDMHVKAPAILDAVGHAHFEFGIYVDWGWDVDARIDDGVRIAMVVGGGPAEDAGLRAGDVVVSVAGRDLAEPLDDETESEFESNGSLAAQRFVAVLGDLEIEEGSEFEFEVIRDGETRTFQVAPRRRTALLRRDLREPIERLRVRLEQMHHDEGRFREGLDRLREGFERMRLDTVVLPSPSRELVVRWGGRWRTWDSGLDLVDLNPDLGAYFGASTGVLVAEADADSWTGLRGGDVVTHVDGRAVEGVAKLRRILRSYDEGEQVRFRIRRDGEETTVSANMK